MDADIRAELIALNDQFLDDAGGDLSGFETRFQSLLQRVQTALAQDELSPDTIAIAQSVSHSISVLAEAFIQLHEHNSVCQDELQQDIERILHDTPNTSKPEQPNRRAIASDIVYIPAAYDWLISNLHSPYPPKSIRAAITRSAQCSREVIDNWFTDVRKQTGWTDLCKKHFSGKKKDAVDAATRFFIAPDPRRPLSLQCHQAFRAFSDEVHALHHKALPSSTSARTLSQTSSCSQGRSPRNRIIDPTTCYPSPSSSPGSVSVCIDGEEQDLEAYTNSENSIFFHSQTTFNTPITEMILPPSPAASHSDECEQGPSKDVAVLKKRKRRLSDGDQEHPVRRIRPRPQTVSESYIPDAFNPRILGSWFEQDFATPQAELCNPDILDVELFDFSDPLFTGLSAWSYPSTSAPQTPPLEIFNPDSLPHLLDPQVTNTLLKPFNEPLNTVFSTYGYSTLLGQHNGYTSRDLDPSSPFNDELFSPQDTFSDFRSWPIESFDLPTFSDS